MLLDFVRPGNALIVGRVDRLARSLRALPDIVHPLKARGAALRATEQPVDTGAASGKAFLLGRLGVFAGFGTNLRRARQREGIKAAKDPYQRRKAMPAASATADAALAARLSWHVATRRKSFKRRNAAPMRRRALPRG